MAVQTQHSVTISEAAGLVGVERHQIRNEFQRVLGRGRAGRDSQPRRYHLRFSELLYFAVIRMLKEEGFDLLPEVRRTLYEVLQQDAPASVGAWRRVDDLVRLEGKLPFEILLDDLRRDLQQTTSSYLEGKNLISRDSAILGGEPVFSGTRIPVRQVVDLFKRGATVNEVQADYPTLDAAAIEYARIKARVGEGPGRPPKPLKVQRRTS